MSFPPLFLTCHLFLNAGPPELGLWGDRASSSSERRGVSGPRGGGRRGRVCGRHPSGACMPHGGDCGSGIPGLACSVAPVLRTVTLLPGERVTKLGTQARGQLPPGQGQDELGLNPPAPSESGPWDPTEANPSCLGVRGVVRAPVCSQAPDLAGGTPVHGAQEA